MLGHDVSPDKFTDAQDRPKEVETTVRPPSLPSSSPPASEMFSDSHNLSLLHSLRPAVLHFRCKWVQRAVSLVEGGIRAWSQRKGKCSRVDEGE